MSLADEATENVQDHAYLIQRIKDLDERIANIRNKEIKTSFIAYVGFSLFALFTISFAAIKFNLANLLTKGGSDSLGIALGAAALTSIAGWFGYLAFKRLELYDQEMHRIRTMVDDRDDKLRLEQKKEFKAARERADKLREEQRADFKAMKEGFGAEARTQIDKAFEAASRDQAAKIQELSETADQTVAKLKRYDFLRERAAAETSVHLEQGMLSLEAVNYEVQNLFNKASAFNGLISQQIEPDSNILAKRDALRAEALTIVRQALEKDVQGDAADYHNFAAELGRNSYYVLAVEALERGIKRFPANTDLIADAVQMALGAGDMKLTEHCYARLRQIDWRKWTWRGFSFSIKYLIAKGDEEEAQELYGKALEYMPFDESPVVQYTQLFLERGQTDKAMAVLEESFKRLKSAPQVAFSLARVYKDLNCHVDAIAMGQAALRMDAQDQSRINNAAVHLTIGLAGEALWDERLQACSRNSAAEEQEKELLQQSREFLAHYSSALSATDCSSSTRRAIALRLATVRVNLLSVGLSRDDCDQYFAALGLADDSQPAKDDGEE